MMIKRPLVAALLFAATAASAAPAFAREGTGIDLKALPAYVDRIFVPVVPDAENTVEIGNLTFDRVLEAPQGFALQPRNGRTLRDPYASPHPAGRSALRPLPLI